MCNSLSNFNKDFFFVILNMMKISEQSFLSIDYLITHHINQGNNLRLRIVEVFDIITSVLIDKGRRGKG